MIYFHIRSIMFLSSLYKEPKEDPRASPSHLEICEACRIEAKYRKRKSFFKFWRKKRAADISYVCPGLAQVQQEIEEQQSIKSASDRHVEDSASTFSQTSIYRCIKAVMLFPQL